MEPAFDDRLAGQPLAGVCVADAMTYRPFAVGRNAPLGEVARLLEEHDLDCIPVSDEGWLRGIVSRRDLLAALLAAPRDGDTDPMTWPVERIMQQVFPRATPEMPLAEAVTRMVRQGSHGVPVTIGALLVGMLGRQDALRVLWHAGLGVPD
jgi:CBS domain-containing protein